MSVINLNIMVEQVEKSPRCQTAVTNSKHKSPAQNPRRDLQPRAPIYSSPLNSNANTDPSSKFVNKIGGGIPKSLVTTIRATADHLMADESEKQRAKLKDQQEEDSILLRSSRSDLRSRSPSPKRETHNQAKHDLPLQMCTDRTHNSLGHQTNEEPIISVSYNNPAGLRSLVPRQQASFDNVRTSERLSDPNNLNFPDENDMQLRDSFNTTALKHLYSIKPQSGAKPYHLTSSFSSTSGTQQQHRFNQTGYVNSQKLQGPQSHRALSQTDNLNRSYTATQPQEETSKLIEQMQNDFQRQIRKRENEWATKEALLVQKIEFLEAEVRESKQREAKQKVIHAQMIEAMQQQQTVSNDKHEDIPIQAISQMTEAASQVQLLELEQMYQKQLDQCRQETYDLSKDYKLKLQQKDTTIKDLQIKIESLLIDHQRKIQELELDKKQLENQLKRISLEKTQLETQLELAESHEHQIMELKQQVELLDKEKALQTEKLRKLVREHNDAQVKLEKQIHEKAAERVRQIEKEHRDKEILLQERLKQQLKQFSEDNLRQIEQMQDEQEQMKARYENQLQQVLADKQAEFERHIHVDRQINQQSSTNRVYTEPSLFATQVFLNGGQLGQNFVGHFMLENDASSIQGSELLMPYDEGFHSQENSNRRQTEEVIGLKSQIEKLKQKLKVVRQANDELVEKEKILHKKHKQQIEHVLMSIFLSDRYIKEGVGLEEIEEKDQLLSTKQIREVYQKKINDEIEARINAETQLTELKHQMQKVKSQAQEQLAEKDSKIKLLQQDIQSLTLECESLRKDIEKENQNHANHSAHDHEQAQIVFTPQRASNQKPNHKRPPSQTNKAKSNEPQAPQLLHKTTQNAQVSTLQLKLLNFCQLMVDSASRMECAQCLQLFNTTDFYEHISTEGGNFQCLNHVKMMTNLSHNMSTRQQNRSFQNVSSSQHVVNFKKPLNLIKPRESSAGNLSQFRKAHNSSSLFFPKQRSSLGASMAASSTSIVQSGVPLPLMFHRTSQTSGPLFQHVSTGIQNLTQAFDHTMEESSILQQVPTLNSTTYQQFTQQLNAMQEAAAPSQNQLRSQSANAGQAPGKTAFKQATLKLQTQAQKMTRNSNVKNPLQLAKSVENAKFKNERRQSPVLNIENPKPYTKPVQSSQVVMPLQIKQKHQNQLQSFFSHSHHQTQVNWSQKSWNQLSHHGIKNSEQQINTSSLSQLPPHPVAGLPRRSKADEKPSELSNHKRAQSFTNRRSNNQEQPRFSPSRAPERPSRITRNTGNSSLKTSNNPELAVNHMVSVHENQLISVSQEMYCPDAERGFKQLTSEYFHGIGHEDALNLAENIDKGMPLQDEQESIRSGSSVKESEKSQGEANVNDQIGNGFFKLNYPQGDEKGTSFKRKQDALLSGKLAASNYFRDDSATEQQPLEHEVDSASDWYGSCNNQQNQEMLIAEKQNQMKIEMEQVQGSKKVQGYAAAPPQKTKVVPRLNLHGQHQLPLTQKPTARGQEKPHEESKRTNYATQVVPPLVDLKSNKTSRELAPKPVDRANLGQTQPVSLNNGKLEIDPFDQSLNAQYKLDSFRAFGKPYCTSTKGGQRYDKNNLLVSQSMHNLDQVLDTQDSRPSQTPQKEPPKQPLFNKLNLEKVTKQVEKNDQSLTASASQLNAPRAGRLPTSSDSIADSVNYVRSELSDSIAPDDYVVTKDQTTTKREDDDGSHTNRIYLPTKPEFTTQVISSFHGASIQPRKAEQFLTNTQRNVETKTKTVGIKDLTILMNMMPKPADKNHKIPPIPKKILNERLKGRLNDVPQVSHAVQYFFNETEPDHIKRTGSQKNGNSLPRQYENNLVDKILPIRLSRFKTQSNDDECGMIDSNEEDEDQTIDECDIDSAELQEDKQAVMQSEMYHDNDTDEEEAPATSGFGLFMCTALKDKGTELQSFFKPIQANKIQKDYQRRKRGAQKTFKPSLMKNQEQKFVAKSKSFLGFKLN